MDTSSLMEQILSSDNLNRAYLQVVRNKGAEGVDGMKYTELKEHLVKNGEIIKEQLRTRKYRPQPVRRVEIPKPNGGVRNLGVPTVTDRLMPRKAALGLTLALFLIKCIKPIKGGFCVRNVGFLTQEYTIIPMRQLAFILPLG